VEAAVTLAQEKEPEVIIMQVDRTLEKARDTLQRVREGYSSSPPNVMILTMFDDTAPLARDAVSRSERLRHKRASTEELLAPVVSATVHPEGEPALVAGPQGALGPAEHGLAKDGWGEDGSGRAPSER
jgi:DNA-binding NarL/FixJ family response regulator